MLFEDLRALAAVIECASLTKAAQRLNLTQSAVSRRIQNLEETLGAALFDRTNRPPMPTPMGLRIYESALGLLRDAEHLRRIPQEDAPPHGKFRVGFVQVVADVVVLETVTAIREAYPGLHLQVVTDWSSELQRGLIRGELDAATLMLRSPSVLPEGIAGVRVTTLDICVVQSKRHPIVTGPTDINGLAQHAWILNPKGCGYRAALESAMGGNALNIGVDTHGAAIQMRMVCAGLGLGLVPSRVLQESPLREELTTVEVTDFALRMDIWVAHPLRPGNLRQVDELLTRCVVQGFWG